MLQEQNINGIHVAWWFTFRKLLLIILTANSIRYSTWRTKKKNLSSMLLWGNRLHAKYLSNTDLKMRGTDLQLSSCILQQRSFHRATLWGVCIYWPLCDPVNDSNCRYARISTCRRRLFPLIFSFICFFFRKYKNTLHTTESAFKVVSNSLS